MTDVYGPSAWFIIGSICTWIAMIFHLNHACRKDAQEIAEARLLHEKAESILKDFEDHVKLQSANLLAATNEIVIKEILSEVDKENLNKFLLEKANEAIEEIKHHVDRQEDTERVDRD